jgi:hypothetical protein
MSVVCLKFWFNRVDIGRVRVIGHEEDVGHFLANTFSNSSIEVNPSN